MAQFDNGEIQGRLYQSKIEIVGNDETLENDVIANWELSRGFLENGSIDLGNAPSSTLSITLKGVRTFNVGQKLKVVLEREVYEGEFETTNMGVFYVQTQRVNEDTNKTTLTCVDGLSLLNKTIPATSKSLRQMVKDAVLDCGLQVNEVSLAPIPSKVVEMEQAMTARDILTLAGQHTKGAFISNNEGVVELVECHETGKTIGAHEYFSYDANSEYYQVNGIVNTKTRLVEITPEDPQEPWEDENGVIHTPTPPETEYQEEQYTETVGETTKGEVLQFANPWLTQEELNNVLANVTTNQFFKEYTLSFIGDVAIKLGDILEVENTKGTIEKISVTNQTFHFDGTLRGTLSSGLTKKDEEVTVFAGSISSSITDLKNKIENAKNPILLFGLSTYTIQLNSSWNGIVDSFESAMGDFTYRVENQGRNGNIDFSIHENPQNVDLTITGNHFKIDAVTEDESKVTFKCTYTYEKNEETQATTTYQTLKINKVKRTRQIDHIDTEYYLSDSSETLTGGSWSTTAPVWESGKYYWNRTKTYWEDWSADDKVVLSLPYYNRQMTSVYINAEVAKEVADSALILGNENGSRIEQMDNKINFAVTTVDVEDNEITGSVFQLTEEAITGVVASSEMASLIQQKANKIILAVMEGNTDEFDVNGSYFWLTENNAKIKSDMIDFEGVLSIYGNNFITELNALNNAMQQRENFIKINVQAEIEYVDDTNTTLTHQQGIVFGSNGSVSLFIGDGGLYFLNNAIIERVNGTNGQNAYIIQNGNDKVIAKFERQTFKIQSGQVVDDLTIGNHKIEKRTLNDTEHTIISYIN